MSLTYIQQNGSTGRNIDYPSSAHRKATIATSGCGVCSSLMVLLNSTSYSKNLKTWTKELIKAGCRGAEGTRISKVQDYMKKKYGFTSKTTKNINALKDHLKKGYKAIANVGGKGYFSSSGHYICVAGISKSGKAIVLDPYYYTNKWTTIVNGINRSKYFTYNSSTHEVYCSFDTIAADSKGSKYILFTPTTKKSIKYSSKDKYKPVTKKNKPKVKVGNTVTLLYERGIYKGYGSNSGRKKVKDLTTGGKLAATSKKGNDSAYFRKGTKCTVIEVKTLSNKNIWIKVPSGYMCVYEYDKDLCRIK